jgi:hypothetical protein
MKEKHRDMLFTLVVLSTIGVFMFGMIYWPTYQASGKGAMSKNLYYITVSFTMYMLSFIVMLFAKSFTMKAAASLLLSVFGVNLYIELFLDPKHWTDWDFTAIVVFAANLILSFTIIEKIKQSNEQ